MVELAIFLLQNLAKDINQNQRLVKTFKRPNLLKLHEDFLESVFGAKLKLEKQAWIEKVSSQAKWILAPEQIRHTCVNLLDRQRDATSNDEPDWVVDARWVTKL